MSAQEQSQQKQRLRAAHKKSGNGCITCKARHVRCDERRPGGCVRCERSGRQCGGYEDKSGQRRFQFKAFKAVSFDQDDADTSDTASHASGDAPSPPHQLVQFVHRPLSELPYPAALNSNDSLALDFFSTQTIPLLSRFCYPRLWSGPTLHFIHSTPVLRQIALAVGSQHMQMAAAAAEDLPSAQGTSAVTISNTYYNALGALRKVIHEGNPDAAVIVLMACLLLVLHDYLGMRKTESAVHLYNGLRLIGEDYNLRRSDIGAELITTIRRLGLNSILSKPDQNTYRILRATRPLVPNDTRFPQLDQIRTAIDDVSASCFGFISKVAYHAFPSYEAAVVERNIIHAKLDPIYAALAAYDEAYPQPQGADSFMRPILQARSILTSLFVKNVATGFQTSYDKYLSEFKTIIKLLRRAIVIIRRDFNQSDTGLMPLFSLDLGIISTLAYTGGQCRDSGVRRECMELLQLGPSRDGAWDRTTALWTVWHRTRFEESLADNFDESGHCVFIPEECRIYFVEPIEPCEENGYVRQLHVQWRPNSRADKPSVRRFNLG